MAQRLSHGGGAVLTELQEPMTASSPNIFEVADATGWPTTDDGPLYVVIDRGTELEEKVLIAQVEGTSLTVSLRGADDTTAVGHAAGATVEHVFTAIEADEANSHLMSPEGVHGLGAGDRIIGQSHLTEHAALDNGVHGAPPGDPLMSRADVVALINSRFVAGEVRHFLIAPSEVAWLLMDGSLKNPAMYPDLFTVLGTAFGGDGVTTFGIPNAIGAVVRGATSYGPLAGSDTVSLAIANLPAHAHGAGTHIHTMPHTHKVNPPATSTDEDTHKHDLFMNTTGGGWNGAVARGANDAGVSQTSGQAIVNDTHSHNINIAEFDSGASSAASTGQSAGQTASVGSGTPATIIPRHLPALPFVYAGQVVT
jgi:microcystin-dependent protein